MEDQGNGGGGVTVSFKSKGLQRRRGVEGCGHLQEEGQDGGAQWRVVAELLQVAAVLPLGPHRHLDEAHQGEEGHRQALGHQREAEPRAELQGPRREGEKATLTIR